jgi:hypothetical protein
VAEDSGRGRVFDAGGSRAGDPLGEAARDRLGRIDDFAGRGDDVDGAHELLGRVRLLARAEHLEGELRQAVAETLGGRSSKTLENHIGGAAIGWRVAYAVEPLDVRVGLLALGAAVHADHGARQRFAVSPDAADAADRALGDGDGEPGHLDATTSSAALAAAAFGPRLALLAEVSGLDDVAAGAHAPVDARDDRAFGGAGDTQVSSRGPSLRWVGASPATMRASTAAPMIEPIAPPIGPPSAVPAAVRMIDVIGQPGKRKAKRARRAQIGE